MKFSNGLSLSLAFVGLVLMGCERHSFDETKGLFLEHGAGHHEAGHGSDAHAKDAHAKEGAPAVKHEAAKEEARKTGL